MTGLFGNRGRIVRSLSTQHGSGVRPRRRFSLLKTLKTHLPRASRPVGDQIRNGRWR